MQIDEMPIRVHQVWNGCRTAEVRLGDLQEVRWLQPPGAPRPLVHADVSCARILSGGIPHECNPTDAPHRLVVCILKKHVIASAYVELARRADASARQTHSGPPGRYAMIPFRTA